MLAFWVLYSLCSSLCRSLPTLQVSGDGLFYCHWVGTNDLTDLFAVLEEQESRHGADSELLSDIWDLVDIELVEAGLGVSVGEPVMRVSKLLTSFFSFVFGRDVGN